MFLNHQNKVKRWGIYFSGMSTPLKLHFWLTVPLRFSSNNLWHQIFSFLSHIPLYCSFSLLGPFTPSSYLLCSSPKDPTHTLTHNDGGGGSEWLFGPPPPIIKNFSVGPHGPIVLPRVPIQVFFMLLYPVIFSVSNHNYNKFLYKFAVWPLPPIELSIASWAFCIPSLNSSSSVLSFLPLW